MKKKVCITGASGYLASHIIINLLDAAYNVKALTRNKQSFLENNYPYLQEICNKNIQNLSIVEYNNEEENNLSLIEILSDVDYLIHCASPVILQNDANEKINMQKIIEPAIKYTRKLLTTASFTNIQKIIFTSSTCAIYDGSKTNYSSEDWADETKVMDAYSISKIRSEKIAWEIYNQTKKWELVVLNPGRIIGPTIYDHIPESFCSIKEAQSIQNNTNKNPIYNYYSSFCDVRDVAKLHIYALHHLTSNRYIITFEIKGFKDYCEEILEKKVFDELKFITTDFFTFECSFTPFRIEDAQSNGSNPFISAPKRGISNENWCKTRNYISFKQSISDTLSKMKK